MAKADKKKKDKTKTKSEVEEERAEAREIPIGDGGDEPIEEAGGDEGPVEVDPLAALEVRVKELEDQKLRALAEMDNYRKRMARQFEDVVRSANDRLLGQLLEVVDNFERALAHSSEDKQANGESLAALREGTELIYHQMIDVLDRHNVKSIESIGRPFDPTYHEALMQIPSDEYDEGIVVTEVNKGYTVGDRVLRYAQVAVSNGPEAESKKED